MVGNDNDAYRSTKRMVAHWGGIEPVNKFRDKSLNQYPTLAYYYWNKCMFI